MAKESFSFDVVSEVEMDEVTNAIDQARREVSTRFDFKDTGTAIALQETSIEVHSSTDERLKAAVEVLKEKMIRRKVPLKALSEGAIQPAAKGTAKMTIQVSQGISDEKAREIVKAVKGTGLKVQSQIQGDQIRVSGKKKDELQSVIASLKGRDLGIPLQFVNFRP
ncbi:MAG: YajQ family cyclic di-GMP-binding protein [Actinomycetota bacterium]